MNSVAEVRGPRRLYIAVVSRNFFGAERRYLRIVRFVRSERPHVRVHLVINSSLYRAAKQFEWSAAVLDAMAADRSLSVLPNNLRHLSDAINLKAAFAAVTTAGPVHTVLRARPLAYLRGILHRPAVVELTSPDVADQVALGVPFLFLSRVNLFRAVSPAVAKRFISNLDGRFASARVERIAAKVTTSSSPYVDGDAVDARLLDRKDNLIISASRFTKRKNVVLIARALALALPQLPEWRAMVLGKGEQEGQIRDILAPMIAQGRVVVGYDTKIESRLAASRIYLSMIEPDNYPSQSILEAMRCGNALILSDTGDSSLFVDDENGDLVPLDVSALASAIVRRAQDDAALRAASAASVRHAQSTFSVDRHIDELLHDNGIY